MSINFNDVSSYPLSWPDSQPRTLERGFSRFASESVAVAVFMLQRELSLLGADEVKISTNIRVKADGFPSSEGVIRSRDPGAAVYFVRNRRPICIACDKYMYVEDNLKSIAKTIEAIRGIERWGSSEFLDQAFVGFTALPAPEKKRSIFEIVGLPSHAPTDLIVDAYTRLRNKLHPDAGGNHEKFVELQSAMEKFKKERGL